MTEVESLIIQAQEILKKWRKPKTPDFEPPQARSWREILESRTAPKSTGYKV